VNSHGTTNVCALEDLIADCLVQSIEKDIDIAHAEKLE